MASDSLRTSKRRSRFETFEERLALSVNPVGDYLTHGDFDSRIEHHYAELVGQPPLASRGDFSLEPYEDAIVEDDFELAPLLNDAHALTGLDTVRNAYGFTGRGQTVAIIDSGIAYDHQALGGGFGSSYRVVGGWDFAENDSNPYDDGPAGFHGTHVAGIVGSSNATYRGVAHGVDLVALRVFDDSGAGYFSWTEQALQWVHAHRNDFANPITTVNLSLGTNWNADTPPNWAMLEDEFAQLKADGIFISVSAGNSFTSYNAAGLSYPASSPHVVPVASVDNSGSLSYFSQRNSRVIAAPGRSVISTVPDYVNGADGVINDFAAASGTSMAAPYVAGAAALVREAMQFVGYTGITQDTIYDHLRNTADVIHDSVTNADYFRLHVQRAIESLMPADDYGSSAGTAHSLGTVNSSASFEGIIGRLDDVDYFRFTSSQTGRITFTTTTSNDQTLDASLVGGTASINGNQISFDVVAGQSYTLSFASPDAITRYEVSAVVEASATDLGTVAYQVIADQSVSSSRTYRVTAQRDGIFTVQASFTHSNGNIDLEVRDSNRALLNAGRTSNNQERVDVSVTAGQVLYVDLTGTNVDVDLCLANLVRSSNQAVEVWGSGQADTIVFAAGATHSLTINGLSYQFAASQTNSFTLHGGSGYDSLTLRGTSGDETAIFQPGSVTFAGGSFQFAADTVEFCAAYGCGGNDTARFYDSAGNDDFFSNASFGRLAGASFYSYAEGFNNVYAYANAGGTDQATIFDTSADDELVMTPDYSRLSGGSVYRYAAGFETVTVTAAFGGDDRVSLHGSSGAERFISSANSSTLQSGSVQLETRGFERVFAYGGGGHDRMDIYDSAGNDDLILSPQFARITGGGSYRYAEGFESLYAFSSGNGEDRVSLFDTAGNDEIIMTPSFSRIAGNDYYVYVTGFDRVDAYASGGNDRADLYDSFADDHYLATPTLARMTGTGYYNYAAGFEQTFAFATAGGNDTVDLHGTGQGDELIARPQFSRLLGSTFYQYAQGFQRTNVYSGNATLFSTPYTSTAAGLSAASVNYITDDSAEASPYSSASIALHGFAYITARDRSNEYAYEDIAAVDFLFEMIGEES